MFKSLYATEEVHVLMRPSTKFFKPPFPNVVHWPPVRATLVIGVGTLDANEGCMDKCCFFSLIISFFSFLIYLNVLIIFFLTMFFFSFGQIWQGRIVPPCRRHHRYDPMTASRCQVLRLVASRTAPFPWRCFSFIALSRRC